MIRFFRILIDNLPGGMGIVGTVVCLFCGAISGQGFASVAAISPMIIKSMEKDGYPPCCNRRFGPYGGCILHR
jgi:C4-dicarboxylate transporter DctM subunit